MRRQTGRTLLSALLALSLTLPAFARRSHGDNDRASFGSDITIAEGETVGDVACAFCSVHIHGDVTGDVAVAFGSVTVDPARTISGDTAILKGNLNLGEGSTIHGDLAIMAGAVHLADGATINGSQSVIPEPFGTLILISPLLILAGIIWLIVYLVRRNRYRFPVYPQGRGIQPPPPPPIR
jgi:hypothetical protein